LNLRAGEEKRRPKRVEGSSEENLSLRRHNNGGFKRGPVERPAIGVITNSRRCLAVTPLLCLSSSDFTSLALSSLSLSLSLSPSPPFALYLWVAVGLVDHLGQVFGPVVYASLGLASRPDLFGPILVNRVKIRVPDKVGSSESDKV